MKTLLKTCIIGSLLFSVSCNSNDDDVTTYTGNQDMSIVGVWDLINTDGTFNTSINGIPLTGTISGSNYDNSHLTFTENPNKVDINYDYSMALSASILGLPQTFNEDINESQSGLDWTKANNTLSVSGGTNNYNFEIIEQTNNKLTLKVGINETITFQGQTTEITGFSNHYYSK